ncbi:hypothetical protein J1792_27215 [Streptomyces triculaminicus]|uniref:Uncharacterized protein n=2 Tax=Streptomyces TaxID=1883 RepID=A0A939FT31_9ACTN|nr:MULTISPECIES: hypothetical protein [Streptomyces]MBO0656329.1 hypothetical protein [Streptomyces triculaminicus]QSY50307.1 hypothetical protein J3S04_04530 [Streptomyces griseocarneus]
MTRIAIATGAGLLVLAPGNATAQARSGPTSEAESRVVNVDTRTTPRASGRWRIFAQTPTPGD